MVNELLKKATVILHSLYELDLGHHRSTKHSLVFTLPWEQGKKREGDMNECNVFAE